MCIWNVSVYFYEQLYIIIDYCYYYYDYQFSDQSLSSDQWEAVSSKSRIASESNLTRIPVSRIISHPGVKYEKLRYFNDTVLVELGVSFNLSDEVNTICLPENVVDDKQPCVTASWSYESPGGMFKIYNFQVINVNIVIFAWKRYLIIAYIIKIILNYVIYLL